MFWRILKKNLKENIGFNIVLTIFMIVASTLVVAGVLQLYVIFEGYDRSYEVCNSSDVILVMEQSVVNRSEQLTNANKWFSEREDVENVEHQEAIRYNSKTLDLDNFVETRSSEFKDYLYYLVRIPQEQNLVLDMDDKTFSVENGCVAIPKSMQMLTGTQKGDKLRITTQMGNVYEFTVSHIFKDPAVTFIRRVIVSDNDYEKLYDESPVKYDYYHVQQSENCGLKQQNKLIQDFRQNDNLPEIYYASARDGASNDIIIAKVIALFMLLVSVFLILLILMTIRFTIVSAIKREEREIGMMKAIGIDSVFYKWIFANKYIGISAISGLVGIVAGIPLSNIMIKRFCFYSIVPGWSMKLILAVGAALFSVAVIIMVTFLAMRRMNKITVMDALHGEHKGERFNNLPGFFLHRRKYMKPSLFLAVTDLLGRMKRYIFLMIAYMLGMSMILMVVQLKDSVICEEFWMRYGLLSTYEFEIHLNEELHDIYYQKGGGKQGAIKIVNEDLVKAGIPATVECINRSQGYMRFEENEILSWMGWGISDTADVTYRKGSVAPELYNEVAIDYYTAERVGIEIGDTININYDRYSEDGLNVVNVTEDFLVTGYFDYLGNGSCYVVMGNAFDKAVVFDSPRFKDVIYAPESQKAYYIEKMRELYGEEYVWNQERVLKDLAGSFYVVLEVLRNVVSVVVLMVLILITVLYQNIFMEEEVADIALLKSMGFDNKNIKEWQGKRMVLLTAGAFVLALIHTGIFGNWFIGIIFEVLIKLSGFNFRVEPLTNYILIPFGLLLVVVTVLAIVLKSVEKIQIWRIRNE